VLDCCCGPGNPTRYPPVIAGRHIQERLLELQQKLERDITL